MRKILYIVAALSFIVSACDKKDEFVNEKSSVVKLAGEWNVRYDHPTAGDDYFHKGYTHLNTYNTSADLGKDLWLTDMTSATESSFKGYKIKVNVDTDALTFSGEGKSTWKNFSFDGDVKIMNGKIIENVVNMTSGAVTDSIYYEVWFSDLQADIDATLEAGKQLPTDKLIVGGYRITGFINDQPKK